ncbi:hypothetical protein [Alkalihalobacillus sp. BA299]|uniref:hypothetical protein n=1 Tax=Alkalihalobacillus sp. BA299 TaxID=2815938 RepID=UPI001ADCAE8B|nr:hypothetical protein [Alkalihalobacillus sp. BA299]
MIIEHIVEGSQNTSLHDFQISINGLDLMISGGSYYQAGQEKFVSSEEATIQIPSPTELTHYTLWLTESGINVLARTDKEEYTEVLNPVDRLAWFSIPANETDLNNVDIHFVKVVEA